MYSFAAADRPYSFAKCCAVLCPMQSELEQVPLYVVVKEVLNKEACVEAVEINYLTFYAFNGPYTIGLPPFAFEAGAHDGDWEHFTVRYSNKIYSTLGYLLLLRKCVFMQHTAAYII